MIQLMIIAILLSCLPASMSHTVDRKQQTDLHEIPISYLTVAGRLIWDRQMIAEQFNKMLEDENSTQLRAWFLRTTLFALFEIVAAYIMLRLLFPRRDSPQLILNSLERERERLKDLTSQHSTLLLLSQGKLFPRTKMLYRALQPRPCCKFVDSEWLLVRVFCMSSRSKLGHARDEWERKASLFVDHLDDEHIVMAKNSLAEHKRLSDKHHDLACTGVLDSLYDFQELGRELFCEPSIVARTNGKSKNFWYSLVVQLQDYRSVERGQLNITVRKQLNGYKTQAKCDSFEEAVLEALCYDFVNSHIPRPLDFHK